MLKGQLNWQIIALLLAITFLVLMIVFISNTRGDMVSIAKDLGSAIKI
jgi:hypothetical protein|tara:strand:+ start:58 stop:201 length:144 start_codon:yes stop_codon:yes gene_type:complete